MVTGRNRHERLCRVAMLIAGCAIGGCEAIVNDGNLKDRPAGGSAQSEPPNEAGTSDVTDAGGFDADQPDGGANAAVEDSGTADSQSGPDDASVASPDDAGTTAGDATPPDGEPASQDSGQAPDATMPDDAAPPDASFGDSAPAPLDAASAGCSPGAVVIPMTKLNTTYKFNTVAAVCVTYKGYVSGWNGSNVQGRSVTVIGATTRTLATIAENAVQPSVAPSSDGYIYWNFSIGLYAYASMDAFP